MVIHLVQCVLANMTDQSNDLVGLRAFLQHGYLVKMTKIVRQLLFSVHYILRSLDPPPKIKEVENVLSLVAIMQSS